MILNTIQKRECLNSIETVDVIGNGGAYHEYAIIPNYQDADDFKIIFQNGARHTEDSTTGICDQDLLEIVRHRLRCFSNGPMPTHETEKALDH